MLCHLLGVVVHVVSSFCNCPAFHTIRLLLYHFLQAFRLYLLLIVKKTQAIDDLLPNVVHVLFRVVEDALRDECEFVEVLLLVNLHFRDGLAEVNEAR